LDIYPKTSKGEKDIPCSSSNRKTLWFHKNDERLSHGRGVFESVYSVLEILG
jgi:hypothetical protein